MTEIMEAATERKPISKKIRFEIFKRDKFTCQYCGHKAPDVVLQVDHIDPVAGGGGNEIVNLITSCFACNSGKKDRKLDDNSVVEKQRKQLEMLQERREQIELMLEWKKSLSTFDDDVIEMIVEYINSKIEPLSLNENGKNNVATWAKKFSTDKILDGIDDAAKKYLKYDKDGVEKTSAEVFLEKIAGVIVVKGMPPVKQKLAYIKGIARNRFYWNERSGAIILNDYVNALKRQGYDDERLVQDLEEEVIPRTKQAHNWTEWRSTLENWTDQINKWEKPQPQEIVMDKDAWREAFRQKEISLESLEHSAHMSQIFISNKIEALLHIGNVYPSFNGEKFIEEMGEQIAVFISKVEEQYKANPGKEIEEDSEFINDFLEFSGLAEFFSSPDGEGFSVRTAFYHISRDVLMDLFDDLYLPKTLYKRKDIDILLKLHRDHYALPKQIAKPVQANA